MAIGYRKLIAMFTSVVSCTLLAWNGNIEPGTYQVVMVATLGGYFAANAYTNTSYTKDTTK